MHKFIPFFIRILFFGFFSAIGLSLDIGVYLALIKLSVSVFVSSIIGSFTAVTIVFFLSGLWIFRERKFNFRKYALWIAYQLFGILFFSYLVKLLYFAGLSPLNSKLSIIPITFISNFFVISFLIRKCK